MDRNYKLRVLLLFALAILATLVLLPSMVPNDKLPPWFKSVFNQKIQYGLDLRGGLHIVYSIDLNKAVDDKATELRRDLEAKLAEASIEGRVLTPPRPPGAITIIPANGTDKIDGAFLSDYDDVIEFLDACPSTTPDIERAVCIRVSSDYADRIKKSAQEQAIRTIRERINERGVAEPSVVSKQDQIIVELPGDDQAEIQRVKDIIERTAKLEFKVVDHGEAGQGTPYMQKLFTHVYSDDTRTGDPQAVSLGIEARRETWSHQDSGNNYQDFYLTASDRTRMVSVAEADSFGCTTSNKVIVDGQVECKISGRVILGNYLEQLAATNPEFRLDDDHQFGYELTRYEDEDRKVIETWRTYFLYRPVELTGTTVTEANVFIDQTNNQPYVLVNFNRFGARRFGELTAANVGRKIAVILDDKVKSAPIIQGPIPGGATQITMGEVKREEAITAAEDLRDVLRTGALPAPLRPESSSVVGPLLGRDAVDKTKNAFIFGSLLVVLIMIFYYRTSGTISIVALCLNIGFMMAMLAAFQATLTLPGIAAVVLTVGMAVDANIIIYERIREELRSGKSVKGAVDAGFSHAFSAIFDGQITTGVAAYVLYQYGSGPIKGFAVMLMIGIVCTLFTALWVTRLFFDFYVGRRGKATVLGI